MKRISITVVSAAAFFVLGTNVSLADNHEPEEMSTSPVETFQCDYVEGKGPADLQAVIDEWNAWMDDEGQNDYYAAVLTPQFFGERNFDIGWVGAWPDAIAMGAGIEKWINDGSDLGAKFFEVIDCQAHSAFISAQFRAPQPNDDESDDTFVLSFTNCSIKEGRKFEEFRQAQDVWNDYSDENGMPGGTWVWFPVAGETNNDYDFKYIVGTDDYAMYGNNWQKYSEGHWRKSSELFADLVDCDIGRVYDARTIRDITGDD
jgi:hypothetical protein